jgi:hypothetical protein
LKKSKNGGLPAARVFEESLFRRNYTCRDLDRRLHRLESKFEQIEHFGAARERALPGSFGKLKHSRKKD